MPLIATTPKVTAPNNANDKISAIINWAFGPVVVKEINADTIFSFSDVNSDELTLLITNKGLDTANVIFPEAYDLGVVTWLKGDSFYSIPKNETRVLSLKKHSEDILIFDANDFIPQMMTTPQKLSIASPFEGMTVYDITLKSMSTFSNGLWVYNTSSKVPSTVVQRDASGVIYADVVGFVTLPVGGNSVYTETNQSINGVKTFKDQISLESKINLGSSLGNRISLVSDVPSANRVYTISDVGASASFILSEGNQTLNGVKTFSSTIQGTSYRALWGDLAEMYSIDSTIPEENFGYVVSINKSDCSDITLANDPKDVFGVISSNPAFVLNDKVKGVPVALTGRVPCRILGKISKGDKVVLSDIAGIAMKDDFSGRQVIGKSLQSKLDESLGVVEIATSI